MSKEVYRGKDAYRNDGFYVTNFYGGEKRGACVQITLTGETRELGYLQIPRTELTKIAKAVEDDIELD
jgi:hypothetical protein